MFDEDGTQKGVTLSASTTHSGYDVAWVSIHAAHYPQQHLPFDMGTHNAYQWFQVRETCHYYIYSFRHDSDRPTHIIDLLTTRILMCDVTAL